MARASAFAAFRSYAGGTLIYDWRPDINVVQDRVLSVADALSTLEVPLFAAREIVSEDIREAFETQSDPEGRPWVEWSESYAPFAEEHNLGEILEQTFELENAAVDEGAMRIMADSLYYDLESLPERGMWHQEGRRRAKGGDLPARPFLGLSDDAANRIFVEFSTWFDRSVDRFSSYVTSTGRVGKRYKVRGPMGRFVAAD